MCGEVTVPGLRTLTPVPQSPSGRDAVETVWALWLGGVRPCEPWGVTSKVSGIPTAHFLHAHAFVKGQDYRIFRICSFPFFARLIDGAIDGWMD